MGDSWEFFLILTICFLAVQAYFSMMEMALVSFNRVRLQYYVSQDQRRAIWISQLLSHPTKLFGTTLIGINGSLQIGSECARRFYANLGLDPDWAPLTQIILVVLFAELTPMFAARAHAEHVAILGIRLLYFCSWLFSPIIWILNLLIRALHYLFPSAPSFASYLTREELQRAVESRVEKRDSPFNQELTNISNNIFGLKMKTPKDLMIPLSELPNFQENISAVKLKEALSHHFTPYITLYHERPENIIGVVLSRDLLRVSDNKTVRDLARSTWFVTEKNSIHQILRQFRSTSEHLAVILDENGKAKGIITLDNIINDIFYGSKREIVKNQGAYKKQNIFIDRSFPAHAKVEDINRRFHLLLPIKYETLEDLMTDHLGHTPKKGERVKYQNFELIVEDSPLMVEKSIRIKNC
jgi:CBS domain containing-hemolysin-like protein